MVKEAKPVVAKNPGSGNQLNAGADLRAQARLPGRTASVAGGCGGNADRIIAEVRSGLEALRLEIQAVAREQQKHLEDALDARHEEVLNGLSEIHPEIQDVDDELEEELQGEKGEEHV